MAQVRRHRAGASGRFRRGPSTGSGASGGSGAVVPRAWPGATVVCVGGGPSLTQADVDHCRGRAAVIAINDAYRLAPWADVLYSSDQRWYEFYKGAPEFTGVKYGIRPLNPPDAWGITVLENTGVVGLEAAPTGLRNGRNSGFAAINLAVHFGAKRVLLLGYDMGHLGGKSHWFGDHPQRIRAESPYQGFIDAFDTIVEPLRKVGVSVVNCTRRTALGTFEMGDIFECV